MALDLSTEHKEAIHQALTEARDQKPNNGGVVTISREKLDELKKFILKTLEEIITIIIKIIESENEERLNTAITQELLNTSLQGSVTEVAHLRERLLERALKEGLIEEVKKKGFIFTTGISVLPVEKKRVQQQLNADFDRLFNKAKEQLLKNAQKNMDDVAKSLNADSSVSFAQLFQLGRVIQILEVIKREQVLDMRQKEFQEQLKNENVSPALLEKLTGKPSAVPEQPAAEVAETKVEQSAESPKETEAPAEVPETKEQLVDEKATEQATEEKQEAENNSAGNQVILDEFLNTLHEEIEREKKSIEDLKNKIGWYPVPSQQ